MDKAESHLMRSGSIGVMPTDTIYGLVARATDQVAIERLYELKHLLKKPGTVIAADIDQLVDLGIKRRYLNAVSQFWPGAVSVEMPVGANLSYLHIGRFSFACRIPSDKKIVKLLKKVGPLLTTSANLPDKPPANNINEAKAYFKDKVDFYIDAGDLSDKTPSTIIRVVDDMVEVMREGAVKIQDQS